MLSRRDIDDRLAEHAKGKRQSLSKWPAWEREALETAKQLAEWLEAFADWADLACANASARIARTAALTWLEGRDG